MPTLRLKDPDDLIETVLEALRDLRNIDLEEKLKAEGRAFGGYVCIADKSGFPLLVVGVGSIDAEKKERYLAFCQEKVRRLAQHPEHMLSLQSRNPDQDQYGGAARGTDDGDDEEYLVGFSGLPERLDELLAVLILYKLGDFERDDAVKLLKEHENPYFAQIEDPDDLFYI